MNSFKKLSLISAIALISGSALAMEAIDDQALSNATGQDGITMTITPPALLTWSTVLHDSDGFTGFTASAGAIDFGDPLSSGLNKSSLAVGAGGIVAVIDATGDVSAAAGNQASLNVAVSIPTGTVIHTGDLTVAHSNGLGAAVDTPTGVIMSDITITLGATTATLSLGNENAAAGQASMIRVVSSMTGGLSMANFALNDGGGAQTGGAFRAANIKMVDTTGTTNLAIDAKVDAIAGGLLVNLVTFGTGGVNTQITGLKFGNAGATAIGNVDVIGMALAGTTILIAGH